MGIPIRDLPSEFGARDAVYNRLRRWVREPPQVTVGLGHAFGGAERDTV